MIETPKTVTRSIENAYNKNSICSHHRRIPAGHIEFHSINAFVFVHSRIWFLFLFHGETLARFGLLNCYVCNVGFVVCAHCVCAEYVECVERAVWLMSMLLLLLSSLFLFHFPLLLLFVMATLTIF